VRIELSESASDWQRKAREYADEYLQPFEVEAELNGGVLPPETVARQKKQAIELGFSAIDVPKSHGGLELTMVEQVAIWEQLGRVTNALSWCFSEPQRWMFEACSDEQIETYVLPMMRGEKKDCYAITESGPGSDVSAIEATARKSGDNYVLNGEKWYVTSANLADFFWFQADRMAYTKSWFRHERLMIGARSCGAAARLIDEATDFARERIVDGMPLIEKQAIQFMIADSATELWAGRLMTFEAAEAIDRGDDLKQLHNRCSMVKLYVSEMANRVADRAVQIFGGRGYMRENVAERFYRELRVDRIWEGTSEIQRLIIARGLQKRGLDDL
jgi:alkylation response protein AidB-like acyl-CoA dehydrogenase